MTGCAACRTMRMNGMALKMGVCLSVASFAHLAMTGILKGMGVSGGRLFLRLFFFGGSKKNGHIQGGPGTFPAFCPHRKKKYIRRCKRQVYRTIRRYPGTFPAFCSHRKKYIRQRIRQVHRTIRGAKGFVPNLQKIPWPDSHFLPRYLFLLSTHQWIRLDE